MTSACSNCRAAVQPTWKVCPHCGVALAAAAEAPADVSFSDRPATVVDPGGSRASAPVDLGGPRYRVEQELGRGGMGVVYRAHDVRLDRRVALKRLLTQGDDPHAVARFLTEARAVAALNHPNVLTVYDVGEDEGGYYIAMELIDGISLDRLLEQEGRRLPVERAVQLFRGICEGIAYAHRRNVIHRDVKPSNVLVARDGTPKVVDFGLARQGISSALSLTGHGMGTLDYAAPEQKRDAKTVDHRADVYALGCTFYELLTGHAPPPHPDQIPPAFRALVLQATHPEPAERFFAVSELLDALDRAAKGAAPVAVGPASVPPAAPRSGDLGQRLRTHVVEAVRELRGASTTRGPFCRLKASAWYRSVRPFHAAPGATPYPSPGRAMAWQLTGRGFRYLGHEPKRWAVYFVAGIVMGLVFLAGVLDEFRDEEEWTVAFLPCFLVWCWGFVDVAVTARRIARGELVVEREPPAASGQSSGS